MFSSLPVNSKVLDPKFEFRGVWVATVNNIDWPSGPGLSVDAMKKEAVDLLDMHRKSGMNAIIFQVRPCTDALYMSETEPWSRYLSGVPGKAPVPFFDPLQFWIEETHKREMELHAWLNPFRVAQNASEPLAAGHIAFRNPGWVLNYANKLYFDPGIPAVRAHTVRVVTDIVRRYDIDAIHFDDYFYPYPAGGVFPDTASFALYGRAFAIGEKDHWRRENIDILIKTVNDSVKAVKPWVKFGISPFGVWRNRHADPEGSDTRAGVTTYDHLYADVRKWLRESWIDYVAPQIYWETGHPSADYETLLKWWNDNVYGKDLYIGHALYKVNSAAGSGAWNDRGQMPLQVDLARKYSNIRGSVFFSSNQFRRELLGFQDSLTSRLYRMPSLVPPMPWLHTQPPPVPVKVKTAGRKIRWKTNLNPSQVARPEHYLVYLTGIEQPAGSGESVPVIFSVRQNRIHFEKRRGRKKTYEIRVSALDRLNAESQPSKPVRIKL